MSRGGSILIAIILAGAGLGFLFVRAIRQVPSGQTDVIPVRTDVLTTDVAGKIQSREVNGQVPVIVDPANYGRDDPFANF